MRQLVRVQVPSRLPFFCIKTIYDLVSHGTTTAGQNECNATYNDTTLIGYGPGFQYSCIHSSNPIENSVIDTVWYNYALASAGTITDENTSSSNPVSNVNTATESICPKGWTLPTTKQMNTNRDTNSFTPVLGGRYANGALAGENTSGYWWGSVANTGTNRGRLTYNGSSISSDAGGLRRNGYYIRCVSEEKAITSLTYMQDMTPEPLDYFLGLVDYRKASI